MESNWWPVLGLCYDWCHNEISWFDIQVDTWQINLWRKKENHCSDEIYNIFFYNLESNLCPVTVLTLSVFLPFLWWKWKVMGDRCKFSLFFPTPCTRVSFCVTSHDSPKCRACSQAMLAVLSGYSVLKLGHVSETALKANARRVFTKIQKWIIVPNDPQQRWILWILSKTRYFGNMI